MYDHKKIEKKWQEKWKKADIFETEPEHSKEKKFITVPYPYASGPMHIGHGRSYVNGDIFARYYRAKGYNVLFPIAFHVTGTPVLAISSSLKQKDRETEKLMKEYVRIHTKDERDIEKIVQSFTDPRNIVQYFSNTMKKDLRSIGVSMNFGRTFSTNDRIYNKFIEWQFKKLSKKNYIEKGKYPILFCPVCESAAGEDDIKAGDEKNLGINEFYGIKFPFQEGYLVASTLRPETLFGITNIWINSKGDYVKVKINDEIWIISKHSVFTLRQQGKTITIQEEFKGKHLIGKKAKNVINDKELMILPAKFVDTTAATGVVYSVPAHAPYDYIALKDLKDNNYIIKEFDIAKEYIENIDPIKIIDLVDISENPAEFYVKKFGIKSQEEREMLDKATNENYKHEFYHGKLNQKCGKYQDKIVSKAVDEVIEDLLHESKAIRLYVPITKDLECRCGGKIIVSILDDQWFLNYNAGTWKDEAYKCLSMMKIIPKKYRLNFEKVFEWLDKRPCARKRGLGTRLPFDQKWIIESLSDSTIYMAFYTIVRKMNENKIDPISLSEDFFDYVFLNKGKVDNVSELTGIDEDMLINMRKEFEYWYPVDHRHTAIMHISNHLSFFIFHHTAIFPEEYWPKCITLIEPVIIEGQKMGKSKGNVISLAEIERNYSADLFRFYISHSADLGVKVDWRKKQIKAVQKHISKFLSFLEKIKNDIDTFEYNYDKIKSDYSKAITSRCIRIFKSAENALGEFNLRKYLQQSFYEIFSILKEFNKFSEDKMEYNEAMKIIIPEWLKILSPTMPHICEELWNSLGFKSFISLELWDNFKEELIDVEKEREFDYIENVIEDIKSIKKVIGNRKVKTIYLYTSPNWKKQISRIIIEKNGNFEKIVQEVKNIPQLISKKETVPFIKAQINRDYQNKVMDHKIKEPKILRTYKSFMEKKVKSKILINSDYDPKMKAKKANPLKPGIFLDLN
jgi:leucyl-tRNA synthetase